MTGPDTKLHPPADAPALLTGHRRVAMIKDALTDHRELDVLDAKTERHEHPEGGGGANASRQASAAEEARDVSRRTKDESGLFIPRRELVTLLAYLESGSHKATARRLGISESTSRQRVSQLINRVGAGNAAQAAWWLRDQLEAERPAAP